MIKNDVDLSPECGFLKNDKTRLCIEFKNIIMGQNEENSEYNKFEEKSFTVMIWISWKQLLCFKLYVTEDRYN